MDAVSVALQLAASAVTIAAWWLMGSLSIWGPLTAIMSEIVWCFLIVYTGLYGLLPLCMVMSVVHFRNYAKWSRVG